MTAAEFAQVLVSTGLPVAYLAFPADEPAPTMPFITYQDTGSDNVAADNKVWFPVNRMQIDLFCERRSLATEKLLEDAFDTAEIFWERVLEHDMDEDCYRVTYELEI